jgi:hypothetical protein
MGADTYTLTVTVTCGNDQVIICQNVTLPASRRRGKEKANSAKRKPKPAKRLVKRSR